MTTGISQFIHQAKLFQRYMALFYQKSNPIKIPINLEKDGVVNSYSQNEILSFYEGGSLQNKKFHHAGNSRNKENSDANIQAINQIEATQKNVSKDIAFNGYQIIKKKAYNKKIQHKNERKQHTLENNCSYFTHDEPINPNKKRNKVIDKKRDAVSHNEVQTHFIERMKNAFVQKIKLEQSHHHFTNHHLKEVGQHSIYAIKKVFNGAKKVISSINTLGNIGVGLTLILVVVLFIGVFSSFSNDTGVIPPHELLNTEVLVYQEDIEKYANEYGMESYVPIIMALMMEESKGIGTDPMGCSECPLNTLYPQVPQGILDIQYSLQIGIQYLALCFQEAGVTNNTDNELIHLGLQGYNYGTDYITWALKYFGGYTKANAKVYSEQKKRIRLD